MQWKVGTSIFRMHGQLAGSLKTTDLQGGANAFRTYPLSFKLAATLPISPPPMFALAWPSQHLSPTQYTCFWVHSNQRIEEDITNLMLVDYIHIPRACNPLSPPAAHLPASLTLGRSMARRS